MRDLLVFASMWVLMPLALINPFVAFLLWAWTAAIGLNSYMYGFMLAVPFNMIFAIIAMASILLGRDAARLKLTFPRTSVLYLLLALQATLSVVFAYDGLPRNVELYGNLIKALIFCFFMPWVLTQRYRVHAFVIALALGSSFHGLVEGLKFFASGGDHRIQGLAKFGDNNQLAIVIILGIPLLIYLYQYSAHRLLRLVLAAGIVLSIAAVIATHSRGGFVALFLMLLTIALASRRKWLGFVLIAVGLAGAVVFAPDSWSERMNTIKEAENDTSFMSRVVAWKVSSAIALDRPITGGGFHAVQSPDVWNAYRGREGLLAFWETPYWPETAYAAHSVYFETLGDMGFIGFFIFLAILANAFHTLFRVRRSARRLGEEYAWARDLAAMLAASMVGYVVGAAALSLAYLELMYMLVMLIQVLWLFVQNAETASARSHRDDAMRATAEG